MGRQEIKTMNHKACIMEICNERKYIFFCFVWFRIFNYEEKYILLEDIFQIFYMYNKFMITFNIFGLSNGNISQFVCL